MCRLTTLFIFLMCSAFCVQSPITIRSGVSKNQAEQQNENVFNARNQKGISNFEADEGFNKNIEAKHADAADSGVFKEENGKKKEDTEENNFNRENFHQSGGGEVSDVGSKIAHKKGHHKSGFHKSYHKDESGSNSSYYDDADDEGDEYVRNTKKGSYGDAGQQLERGSHLDNARYDQNQAKHSQYDNAGHYDKDLANRQNYNRNNYYDNRQDYAQRDAANRNNYGGDDRFVEGKYHSGPYDYDYGPVRSTYHERDLYERPKKRITIYEDPRVYNGELDYQTYDRNPYYNNDYVEIEVKPPYVDEYRYNDRGREPFYGYY